MNTLNVDLAKFKNVDKLHFEQVLHVCDEWKELTEEEFLHIHNHSRRYKHEYSAMGHFWHYEDTGKTIRKVNSGDPYELKVPKKRPAKVTIEYLD